MISKEVRHVTWQVKACDVDQKKEVRDDPSKRKDIKNSLRRLAVILNKYFDIYMVYLPLLIYYRYIVIDILLVFLLSHDTRSGYLFVYLSGNPKSSSK